LYRKDRGANQAEKRAEIRANWCHNSDMQKGAKINQAARSYLKGSYEVEMFLRISIYKTFAKIIFFITLYLVYSYRMPILKKLGGIRPKGCSVVVTCEWF
jgi:hypothetical protein